MRVQRGRLITFAGGMGGDGSRRRGRRNAGVYWHVLRQNGDTGYHLIRGDGSL